LLQNYYKAGLADKCLSVVLGAHTQLACWRCVWCSWSALYGLVYCSICWRFPRMDQRIERALRETER